MKDSKLNHIRIILLVLGSFVVVNAIFLIFSGVFDIVNLRINDQLFKLRYSLKGPEPVWSGGKEHGEPYITMLELDDTGYDELEKVKPAYKDRVFDVDIIEFLNEANVYGIAYDMLFSVEGGQDLVDATSTATNIYYPVILTPSDMADQSRVVWNNLLEKNLWNLQDTGVKPPEWSVIYSTKPELIREAKGIGHINIDPDPDGIFRRIPLLIRHKNGYFPSLTMRMVLDYLDLKPDQVEVNFGKYILLKNANFPDGNQKDIEIPIDDQGQMIINFTGGYKLASFKITEDSLVALKPQLPDDIYSRLEKIKDKEIVGEEEFLATIRSAIGDNQDKGYTDFIFSYSDVRYLVFNHINYDEFLLNLLRDKDSFQRIYRDMISDNLVIVADISTRKGDFGPVPLQSFYPRSNIHANVINSILTDNFLDELTRFQQLIINMVLVLLICYLAIRTRAFVFSLSTAMLFVVYILFVVSLFLYGNKLTNTLPPAVSIVTSFVLVTLYRFLKEEQEKVFLYRTFESYFAPSVMNKILKSPEKLESSERKVLTVMFSDISGFTAWSSTREPEEIHSTLNEYFSEMARVVFKYEGTIDKYIGDGMLVFFGDPIEYDDHALRGVKAAIEMQQKARELKKIWKDQGRLQIEMRIGINTGPVVVGNMGSEKRVDYTVLGSEVNLAQRLEANAPLEGILISKSVYEELKKEEEKDKNKTKDIKTSLFGNINVKGITEEIEVYEVELPEVDKETD